MAFTLKITNSSGTVRFVYSEDVQISGEINGAQALTATFINNLALYASETDSTNAVQLRASVIATREGVKEFEGSINFKQDIKSGNGNRFVTITALDRLADGQRARASQSDSDNWTIESPKTSTGVEILRRTKKLIRAPFNDALTRFIPNTDVAAWASGSPVWEDLIEYNSSPLNQTRYTDIQDGDYTINSATPSGGDTDLAIDATGLPNIDDEFIVGELMLVKGVDALAYVPFKILSNSGITANVLTIQVEGTVTLPTTPKAVPLTIELTTSQNGIFPGGIGLIDDELMWFDGYDLNTAGNYMVRRLRRGLQFIEDVIVIGEHQAINTYDAALSGSDVLITNGGEFGIQVSQNALFPVGAIVTLWLSNVQQGGDFTVATTAWSSPVCTITVEEGLPGSIDEIRTQNRFINIRPQRIATGAFKFEGQDSASAWHVIPDTQFTINLNEGYPVTTLDSIILGSAWASGAFRPAGAWRATYNYYPESTAKSVGDIVEAIAGEPVANGGWGLTSGEIDVSDLSDKITKASNSEPTLVSTWIDGMLTDLGLMGNENIIGQFWDSANSAYTVKRLRQGTATADTTFTSIFSITRDLILDEVKSGLLVKYQLPAPINFAAVFLWAATDEAALGVYPANSVKPEKYGVVVSGEREYSFFSWAAGSNRATIIKNHATFPQTLLLDGQNDTGYAQEYGDNPPADAPDSTTGPQWFVWFDEPGFYSGQVCATKTIKRVKVVVEISRWSNADVYGEPAIDIEVVGFTAFTAPLASDAAGGTDTIPDADPADEVALPGMAFTLPSLNDAFIQEVTLEADNINLELAAIGIKFNKGPTDRAGGATRNVQLKVKEFIVEESVERSLFVSITNTEDSGSSRNLFAPLSYTKLVNPTHLVSEPIDLGVMNEGAANSLARSILLLKLVLEDSREFKIKLGSKPIPPIMSTVQIYSSDSNDTYVGVVLSRSYSIANGEEHCTILLRKMTAPLIT